MPTKGKKTTAGSEKEPLNDDFLDKFYAQCGREVTLAYTTLNQMKNWAMLVAGAVISGVTFGTMSTSYPTQEMFVGIVIAYTFTLRFFVRAMLCYGNLLRWNSLQDKIVRARIAERPESNPEREKDYEEVRTTIDGLYYEWLSPSGRKSLVLANLKLGFSLLFALSGFFLIWGAVALWDEPVVQGLCFFAFGSTTVEVIDILTSRYFDTHEDHERLKEKGKTRKATFPAPQSPSGYIVLWVLVLVISLIISFRREVIQVVTGFSQ